MFGGIFLFVFCLGVLCNDCVVLENLMGYHVVSGIHIQNLYFLTAQAVSGLVALVLREPVRPVF